MQDQAQQIARATADVVSLTAVLGWIAGLVPWIAAFLAGVVSALRLYEMITGKPAKTMFARFRRNSGPKASK